MLVCSLGHLRGQMSWELLVGADEVGALGEL